ncbi:MAG: alpha/beta hydrolase [Actinobacteria bacterium]|nr:MAG: alpha/beta hydrolase [Actinomycetota bacterium]
MDATLLSTDAGQVEVSDRGDGPPVLVLHGSPGGIDVAELMGRFLRIRGFRVIAISRPGYLGTPLRPGNRDPEGQADLAAAVLDELGVERAGVLGWSGAGPMAYSLAALHPARVAALALVAAVSRPDDWQPGVMDRLLFDTAAGRFTIRQTLRWLPSTIIDIGLAAQGNLTNAERHELLAAVEADPRRRDFTLDLVAALAAAGSRSAGTANDQRVFAELGDLPLAAITTPTLLIHGDADIAVELADSQFAAQQITGARLVVVPRGTHMCLFADERDRALQDLVADFLGAELSRRAVMPGL